MRRATITGTGTAALAAIFMLLPGAYGQSGAAPDDPGVARISLISGEVSVQRGDSGEVVAADLNAPLVESDHLFTSPGSRAEIQFDWANMIRVAPSSEVRMGLLGDRDYIVEVANGVTTFRVLRDSDALVEISTPTVSVRPTQQGTYRVEVRPDGETEITVRSGQAEIFTPRGSEILRSGRTMIARGSASDPEYMISSAIPRDTWDRWNDDRDSDLNRSDSYRYVSRDIYGADDLYGYGRWVYDAPYGYVWVPSVAASWAPYRVGRWTYVNYYGWTWLSGDPWGWAPYHYGNWYRSSYGWAWYPGSIGPRYYWRPALVGFFGWGSGSGFSVGVGFGYNNFGYGNIGWVPLAPYEVYRPWYGRGYVNRYNNTTINNITVVNNTNITNIYKNSLVVQGRSGVTGVETNLFGRRGTNNSNYVTANASDLKQAGAIRGSLPVASTAEGRRFSDRGVSTQANEVAARSRSRNTQFAVSDPARVEAARASRSRGDRVATTQPVVENNAGGANRGQRSGRTGTDAAAQANAGSRNAAVNGVAGNNGRPSAVTGTATSPNAGRDTTARSSVDRSTGAASRSSRATTADANTGATRSSGGWRRFDSSGQDSPSRRTILSPSNSGATTDANGGAARSSGASSSAVTGRSSRAPRATAQQNTGSGDAVRSSGDTAARSSSGGWRRFDSAAPQTGTSVQGGGQQVDRGSARSSRLDRSASSRSGNSGSINDIAPIQPRVDAGATSRAPRRSDSGGSSNGRIFPAPSQSSPQPSSKPSSRAPRSDSRVNRSQPSAGVYSAPAPSQSPRSDSRAVRSAPQQAPQRSAPAARPAPAPRGNSSGVPQMRGGGVMRSSPAPSRPAASAPSGGGGGGGGGQSARPSGGRVRR